MKQKINLNDVILAEIENPLSQHKQIIEVDHLDKKEVLSVREFIHRTLNGTLPIIITSYPKYTLMVQK